MKELVAAYERRYQRELRDEAIATAIAHHDPKGLDKAFAAPPARPASDSSSDPGKKWW